MFKYKEKEIKEKEIIEKEIKEEKKEKEINEEKEYKNLDKKNNENNTFMTPSRIQISSIFIIMYQIFVMKNFPFFNKNKFINFMQKKVGEKNVNILTILAIQVIFRTMMIVFFEKLYTFRKLDMFRSQPNKEWLFIQNPEKYEKLRKETYYDYFTKITPSILLLLPLLRQFGKRARIDKNFPSIFEMFYQINGSLLITDLVFYIVHRFIFHSPKYYHLHKDHHAYVNTTVHASMKMSVIDYFFEIILPGMIGPRIFDMHYFTYVLYLISGNAIGIMSHAGYIFPFKPLSMLFPFNEIFGISNNKHHELHHNTFNNNFSALSIFPDFIFNTIIYGSDKSLNQKQINDSKLNLDNNNDINDDNNNDEQYYDTD